ncbi:daptide biosynthesis RiPP recognition protein [Microbacterium sp. NPDC087589]|uniref:daptide biosynthesis RiPP recognition protein n=1 Tax=Microbacterium sp. NPDC087589 TaxID=3364191 RepID=UPI003804AF46
MHISTTEATWEGHDRELVGARALREWITGQHEQYSRVFLVENGAGTETVAEVAGGDDAVLLHAQSGPYDGPAEAVRYTGALSDIGDELFFGERGVEVQDYVAAAFVQIIGPTTVGFFDEISWQSFLDDAELARRTGVFPSSLIDPRVLLANRRALAAPGELTTPSAIRVGSDGRVSVGMQGEIIGDVDDLNSVIESYLPRAVAWGGMAPSQALIEDLTVREWIGRYLNATDLIKMLRVENGVAKISGFGWSLVDDGRADADPLSSDPFLLETSGGFVLADTTTLRRQLLSPVTAKVVAATQTSSTSEIAVDRLVRECGLSEADANTLCRDAAAALNIHFGTRAHASRRAASSSGR